MAEKRSLEGQQCDEIIPKKRLRTNSSDLQISNSLKSDNPSTSTEGKNSKFENNFNNEKLFDHDDEDNNFGNDDEDDGDFIDYEDDGEANDYDDEEDIDFDDNNGDDDDYNDKDVNDLEEDDDVNDVDVDDVDVDDYDDNYDGGDDEDNEEDYYDNNRNFGNDDYYDLFEHDNDLNNDHYNEDDDHDDFDDERIDMEDFYGYTGPVDPLSDLTANQSAVLYTLLLCCDMYGWISMAKDVSMGDIDVRKTLKELESKELVKCDNKINRVRISEDKRIQLMRSYREKCLLSDIDVDFFTRVASGFTINVYADAYIFNQDVSTKPQESCPITLMRLIVQAQTEIDVHIFHTGIFPSVCREAGILENVRHFLLSWCRLRKKVDTLRWADMCPNERIKSVYSASTVCSFSNREMKIVFLTPSKSTILCTILMAENYEVSIKIIEEKIQEVVKVFPTLYHDEVDPFWDTLEEMEKSDKTVKIENEKIRFASDDVRHHVMGYFVMNSLRTDKDYEKFIKLSSVDSLLEYVRTWKYRRGENERCVYLTEMLEDSFIKELGLSAIRHVVVEKRHYFCEDDAEEIRKKVISNVNVPEEILDWDYDARFRYVECAKKGTQTTHRACAMIVGCAGAGKTTLLKRLQNKSLAELKTLRSTIGLEVHEDIFEVSRDEDSLRVLTGETDKEGKQLLSVMDFGGQCAYYACHQVYLSRRAFYLLVLNMSKPFKDKIDKKCCDHEGTMFSDWTYGEYLLFWMKSIHLYSSSDAPVILVGTHLDKTKGQTSDTLYRSILDHLRYDENLKQHLNRKRCFVLGFQEKDGQCLDKLSELEKCIVSIAKDGRWKESIPRDWALCEVVLRELRSTEKMLSYQVVSRNFSKYIHEKDTKVQDVLKLFHEIGLILHFNEDLLSDTVVIDIQWFVDAFKNIITDPNHVLDLVHCDAEWMDFDQNGYLSHQLLKKIWTSRELQIEPRKQRNSLQYMEHLGLIFVELKSDIHYIPCMNKRTFDAAHEEKLKTCPNKTSVLVFKFIFLPWFVYFRLIVNCMTNEWRVLKDDGLCLYKNIACFDYKQHKIALAVNHSSIQLQVFQHDNTLVKKEVTLEARDTIERLLNELSASFHKKIMYTVGYQCSMNEVYREYDKCFVEENEIHGKGQIICPRHEMIHHHTLFESDLLGYWKKDCGISQRVTVASLHGDTFINLYEEGLLKFHFKMFEKLTKVGRDAMQVYFDTVFPRNDLIKMSSRKDRVKKKCRLNDDQFNRLFPANGSDPSSKSFDVTMMYQMLRNLTNPQLHPPINGWGEIPDTSHSNKSDDIERIRIYRNQVVHETESTSKLERRDLEEKGRDLTQAIIRLSNGALKQEMMNAMTSAS